jgi:LmbE family N-acetylglucosaminyl deacetylase
MPTALALSPHLDDAAFSCGGTLTALSEAGWRVVLCTVFTASVPNPTGFALACQTDKGLSPEVDYMALRRAEDAAAAAMLGIDPPLWLPFREAPHRGYDSAKALFAGVRPNDAIDRALAEALHAVLSDAEPDLVLAPQAVGSHVDHIQVVRALRQVQPNAPVLLWRDFPYTIRATNPPEPFGSEMELRHHLTAAPTPDQRERKRRACRAYASQLGFQFGGPERLDALLADAQETFRCERAHSLPFLGALRPADSGYAAVL